MAWDFEAPSGKPKVCVAIPHTGLFPAEWVEKMYVPLKLADPSIDKIFRLSRGSPLPAARTLMVREALKENCTHVFFVDSDVITEENPNVVLRALLECDVPIVSGLYRVKKKEGYTWGMWKKVKGGYVPVAQWTGNWIKVDAIPLGLCLIKTEVFRRIPEPWFYWEDPEGLSEDFYFSELAKKYGYELYVFTDIRAHHIGMFKVKADGSVSTLEV